MAYQNQYYLGSSFASNPFGSGTPSQSLPAPPQTLGINPGNNINITANSRFNAQPFSNPVANLDYADPQTLNRLNINDLIYSPSAGGYLTRADQESNYRPIGGDLAANQRAASFFNYIGSLPTRPAGTPALQSFYAQEGRTFPAEPSLNSRLSNFFNSASPYIQGIARSAGFGPQGYFGPSTGFTQQRYGY